MFFYYAIVPIFVVATFSQLVSTPQATQFWTVQNQPDSQVQKIDIDSHQDLLDFLKVKPQEKVINDLKPVAWSQQPQPVQSVFQAL